MGLKKAFITTSVCITLLISTSTKSNDYKRSNIYNNFSAYINKNKPIDSKYKFDKSALNDLSTAMQKINLASATARSNQLNKQFEWWLSRRDDGFVSNDRHGPNHGCVGGGNGSRNKANHKKRKKRGSGRHDDCGGSDN